MSRTYTANVTTNTGTIYGNGTSYPPPVNALFPTPSLFGQTWDGSDYIIYQTFWEFDLSGLPSSATVSGLTLSVYFSSINSDTLGGDNVGIQPYDWGTSVTSSIWLTPAEINALPGFAAWPAWGEENSITQSTYNTLSIGSNDFQILTYVSGGTLRLTFVSYNWTADLAPSNQLASGDIGYAGSNPPYITVTYDYPVPTITSIEPTVSQLAGGDTATITGTGFQDNDPGTVSVTICGLSATDVTVLSDTSLTCTIPASVSAQVGNVLVTSANNGNATLTDAFTYVNITDSHVYLVKGGVVSGTDHASATVWPLGATVQTYGSSSDMWGLSLAPSDVNADDFGVALAADVGAGHANIEDVEVTVYYNDNSNSQPGTYLIILVSNQSTGIVTPTIYKLPNSGFSPGLDANIQHAVSGADFYTSRLYLPSRSVLKVYRCVEFWCDLSPSVNTPGLQVWASIDDSAFFQLNDATGAAATLYTGGPQRLFFPANTSGRYLQLDLKVPSLGSGQTPVAVTIRDLDVRVSLRAVLTDAIVATLVLGQGQFQDRTTQMLPEPQQLALLKEQLDAGPVVAYTDPVTGEAGYMLITGMAWQPVVFPGENNPTLVAHMQARKMRYDA